MKASRRRQGGFYLTWFALSLVVFLGLAGIAIDVGSAYWKKRDLQAAEDGAALAGGAFLPCLEGVSPPSGFGCVKTAQEVARQYLQLNGYDAAGFTFDYGCMPTGASDKSTCAPRFDYFEVKDHSIRSENTFAKAFGRMVGRNFDAFNPHAMAAACSPCSTDKIDFDVMIVLDRTGSMCQNASGATVPNCNVLTYNPPSDLANAKNGILSFIKFFNPVPDSQGHYDRVGFVVLSGFNPGGSTSSPVAPAYNAANPLGSNYCATGSSNTTAYPGNPTAGVNGNWLLVPLRPLGTPLDATWQWVNPATNALIDTSRLVSAIRCVPGEGNTVINEAARAADAELALHGRTCANCRRIVVMLGDGGANQWNNWTGLNAASALKSTFDKQHPCGSSVSNNVDGDAVHGPGGWGGRAPYAASRGITWFSIGYALDFGFANDGQRCKGDASGAGGFNPERYSNGALGLPLAGESPAISSGTTVRMMASNDTYFFNQPTPGQLYDIFNQIGHLITQGGVRLVR
jgi:hypothetical protein